MMAPALWAEIAELKVRNPFPSSGESANFRFRRLLVLEADRK